MLTCYGHKVRLPQDDLVYLAFRLALQETLSDIELQLNLEEDSDPPGGYLAEVPFLEQVPLPVQVDLLADTWSRHRTPDLIESSLLDAAVVYAACMTAGHITDDMPEVAIAMLRDGPRELDPKIIRRASYRLEEMFERFWDDRDFLMIDDWQDLPPDHAQYIKRVLRLPDEALQPMYDALERWHVSPTAAKNLEGLLTDVEIREAMPLLDAGVSQRRISEPEPEDDGTFVTGIQDEYHDLLVGPCEPAAVEEETQCPLVFEIGIGGDDAFDCTYERWVELFREQMRQAVLEEAQQTHVPPVASNGGTDVTERLQQAQTTGLEDGTKIEAREDGWVVVDGHLSFLVDPEDASWIVGEDDEDMPPAVFPTAEAAYRAWERSEEVAAARSRRRQQALKRLRKS